MRINRAFAALAGLTLIGTAALTGCSSSAGQGSEVEEGCEPVANDVELVEDGVLTVAVAEYPAYVSMSTGELSGADGDILKRIASDLCLTVDATTQSFTAIIETVKAERADMTAGNWYVTPERETEFEVSDPVYSDSVVILSKDGLTSLEDLEGLTVSATQGYSTVPDLQAALGQENIKLYATEEAGFQDLKNGRIDASVMTIGAGAHMLEMNPDSDIKMEVFEETPEVLDTAGDAKNYILIPKGHTKMLDAVNQVLAEMHSDGSLEEILQDNGFDPSAADID
ncbi:MAG: substrate-binding periplasmic protein [Canibacter sp.]